MTTTPRPPRRPRRPRPSRADRSSGTPRPDPSGPFTDAPLTLTARSPEDLLAVVPVVLGFAPEESVVLLTFGARRPFHARVDLPAAAPDDATTWDELAAVLLDPAVRHRAARLVVVLYTADVSRAGAASDHIRRMADRHGLDVLEVLRVAAGRYHPLLAADPVVRDHGVAFDVTHHPFVVQSVVAGRVTHASRADLAATVAADPPAVDRLEARLAGLEPWDPASPPSTAVLLQEGTWARDLVAGHALAGTEPDDADLARLVRSMLVVRVRDAAWSTIGREHGRAHRELWTRLLRRVPAPWLPPVAALLAFAAWQSGDGALAWCALDRCAEVDPDYGLATLVGEVLTSAVAPTTWEADFDWTVGLVA